MDLRWLYAFVVSISLTSANHDSTIEAFYDYTDDYKETKPPSRSSTRTESPLSRYQVTEDIEDIPYPNPPPLPLATNFTVAKPLNIAGGNNSNNIKQDHIVNRDNPKFIKDFSTLPFDFDSDEEVKVSSKNKHPNDDLELDEEFKDTDDDDEHHDHFPDFWPILRTYLYGLEKGIIKGLNGLVSKDVFKRSQVNEPTRNKMTPVWFLNKLKHRKGHSHDNMHGHFDHEYNDY